MKIGTRLLLDVSPLRRYPSFRRLWAGFVVSTFGSQLTVVAVPYEVYKITGSSLDVGLVSLAQLGLLLVGSFGGGPLADAFERRRLLVFTQLSIALLTVGLAVNAMSVHPELWAIFLFSALTAGVSGIDDPTRASLVAEMVPREALASANALWQVLFQLGQVVGPAAAGLLLARVGIAAVFWVNVATFVASILAVMSLKRPADPSPRTALSPAGFVGGLRYIMGHRVLQAVYLIDLNAMIFGMPRALFPALAAHRFHGGAEVYGFLYAAPAAGALLGALLTGWVGAIRKQGLAVLIAVIGWGLAITTFGIATWLPIALVMLAVAGAADVVSAVFRGTIVQLEAPNELRGRIQAVQTAVVTGGPRLGDMESGAVAAAFGTTFSVISGGLICIAGVGVLAKALPSFYRYLASTESTSKDEE